MRALEVTLGNTYSLAGELLRPFPSCSGQAPPGYTGVWGEGKGDLDSSPNRSPQVPPPLYRRVPLPLMVSSFFSNVLPCPATCFPALPISGSLANVIIYGLVQGKASQSP